MLNEDNRRRPGMIFTCPKQRRWFLIFSEPTRFVVKPSNTEQILRYQLVSITVPVGQLKTTIPTQYTIIKCQTPRARDPGLDLTRQEQ